MEGRIEKNTETKETTDVITEKFSSQEGREKIKDRYNNIFSSDFKNNLEMKSLEPTEFQENNKEQKLEDSEKQDENIQNKIEKKSIEVNDISENDSNEKKVENKNIDLKMIEDYMKTPEGLKKLMEKHPEKKELFNRALKAIHTLQDSNASPAEVRRAQSRLNNFKGQLMEIALKDKVKESGLDVENQQRIVEGDNGGTRPDVIAVNNTDQPIIVCGITVNPGETISFECKCGGTAYMQNELKYHIPNQLSGQEGIKVLLATSDIRDVSNDLAEKVCSQYDANLLVLDVSAGEVVNTIKEIAKNENICN